MNIRPLRDRVVVRCIEEERTSPGGIVIPDAAAEKPEQGEVIAVGRGMPLDNGEIRRLDVNVGDKVIFAKYAGNKVTIDGEELMIMRENDLLGVMD